MFVTSRVAYCDLIAKRVLKAIRFFFIIILACFGVNTFMKGGGGGGGGAAESSVQISWYKIASYRVLFFIRIWSNEIWEFCFNHVVVPWARVPHHHNDVIKWKHFPRCWPYVREFIGHRWIPLTKASATRSIDVFFDLRLDKRLSKQSRRRWFKPPSRSLWRHCNANSSWRESVGHQRNPYTKGR